MSLARLRRLGADARVFARLKPVIVKQDDRDASSLANSDDATETDTPVTLNRHAVANAEQIRHDFPSH
jgi:hypothetical protein